MSKGGKKKRPSGSSGHASYSAINVNQIGHSVGHGALGAQPGSQQPGSQTASSQPSGPAGSVAVPAPCDMEPIRSLTMAMEELVPPLRPHPPVPRHGTHESLGGGEVARTRTLVAL